MLSPPFDVSTFSYYDVTVEIDREECGSSPARDFNLERTIYLVSIKVLSCNASLQGNTTPAFGNARKRCPSCYVAILHDVGGRELGREALLPDAVAVPALRPQDSRIVPP